jgi:starvation-inducible outer membrane lipoprotein
VEMFMKRMYLMMTIALVCAGCVSTPQTSALFTPIGAIGVHSFAPAQKPMNASEADRLARLMQERDDTQPEQRVN